MGINKSTIVIKMPGCEKIPSLGLTVDWADNESDIKSNKIPMPQLELHNINENSDNEHNHAESSTSEFSEWDTDSDQEQQKIHHL